MKTEIPDEMVQRVNESAGPFEASEVLGILAAYIELEEGGRTVPNPSVIVMAAASVKETTEDPSPEEFAVRVAESYEAGRENLEDRGIWQKLSGVYGEWN